MKILAAQTQTEQIDWTKINCIVRQTRKAADFVPQATCLTQALAALLLIKLYGQHSDLKIGVGRNENEKFQAHAWLEINGRIIIGKLPKHSQFKVLESIAG